MKILFIKTKKKIALETHDQILKIKCNINQKRVKKIKRQKLRQQKKDPEP